MFSAKSEQFNLDETPSIDDILTKNILVVGLTRNGGEQLKKDINRLHSALLVFSNLSWLIIESDSSDDTREILRELETEEKNFRFISLNDLEKKMPLRTERIAYCRNKYLDEINNNPQYEKIDYVVVADLDGINNLLTKEAMLSCWLKRDWDVCTANQKGPYYDVYALRHPIWSPNDCMSEYEFYNKYNNNSIKSREIAIRSKMIQINENADWLEVDSAFGGLAIYHRHALKGCRYVGVSKSGGEICEHVTLHTQIRQNGKRIFINPKLINAFYTEHTIELKLVSRAKERMYYLFKTLFNRK